MKHGISIVFFLVCFSTFSQSFWDVSVGYRVPVNKNLIHQSGHGIAWDFYFFPLKNDPERKLNFAILGGWTWQDRLWNNKFNKEFALDYKNNLMRSNFSGMDSIAVARLANEIESYHGATIPVPSYHDGIHEHDYYVGMQFFIQGKIRTSIKFYLGKKVDNMGLNYDSLCTSPGQGITTEYGSFYIKRPLFFGGEINLQPFGSIFRKNTTVSNQIYLSFYYEFSDFTKAKLQYWSGCEGTDGDLLFSEILPLDILSKYKKDVRFGLRLGIFLVKS